LKTKISKLKEKKMKEPKFKIGDWCFYEFKLVQIEDTEENRITAVSDGYVTRRSYDLSDRCYPMEMKVKLISDDVYYWSKQFQLVKNLNHPDIHRKLVEIWVDMCENKNDDAKLKVLYERLNAFSETIMKKVKDLSLEEVEGVKIFRQ
jgi:hypothetical protein